MRKAREAFCQDYPTYASQRQYILNWFDRNQPTTAEFTFSISGYQVCWNAFVKVLGITERRFFELKKDFLMGRRSAEHGSFFTSKPCPQQEAAKSFLLKYFSENCDYMPNSNVWHLTSSSRKVEVYEEFGETMQATGQPSCSQSLFRRIWNTDFSHVKIPKVHALFHYKFIQIVSKLARIVIITKTLKHWVSPTSFRDSKTVFHRKKKRTVECSRGGGRYSLYWPTRGGSARKGYLFQASGI